ncbi:MAG TPA: universal stress protein [Methylomirabilota bacterium]|jgi:nucleotide-binding universal stress UspA family protein
MSRRILHPSDFSSASGAAFKKAVEMAKAGRGELMLVHVISPVVPVAGEGYISPKTYEEIAASTRAWAQKQLGKLVAKAKTAGVRAKGSVLEGSAHEQIARFARSRHADLIVMGTHGRSGLAKLFLGSVAGRVVAAAPCPVLTVRGR